MTSLTSLTFPHLYKQVGTADKHQTMEVVVITQYVYIYIYHMERTVITVTCISKHFVTYLLQVMVRHISHSKFLTTGHTETYYKGRE